MFNHIMRLYKQQDYSAEAEEMAVAAARKRRNPVNPIYLEKEVGEELG